MVAAAEEIPTSETLTAKTKRSANANKMFFTFSTFTSSQPSFDKRQHRWACCPFFSCPRFYQGHDICILISLLKVFR
nr:hypothetical protein GZ28G7_7 [uncultured archaeon GZfos28G7]